MSRIMSAVSGPHENEEVVKVQKKAERFTDADKEMMKTFFKKMLSGIILGALFVSTFVTLVLADLLDFSKVINITAEQLPDLQSRMGFTCSFLAPGALWVLGCIYAVIVMRGLSPAMDPTAGKDCYCQTSKNILTNSFEQFVLSMVSQLILVQYLDAEHTLKYIPALNFLYIFGRIAYTLGYPKHRGLGIITNMFPTSLTLIYDFFKCMDLIF